MNQFRLLHNPISEMWRVEEGKPMGLYYNIVWHVCLETSIEAKARRYLIDRRSGAEVDVAWAVVEGA